MKWLIIGLLAVVALLLFRMSAFGNRLLPRAGNAAPDFTLPDQNGKMRSLSDFGARWLVLYFFPRAETPG
jgi:peroxiredoxin Q/BCP